MSLDPNPSPARERFVWRVDDQTRTVDLDLPAILILLVVLDGYNRVSGSVLLVGPDLVLVDMDSSFHILTIRKKTRRSGSRVWSFEDPDFFLRGPLNQTSSDPS